MTALVVSVVMTVTLAAIGWLAYGAHVPGRSALALTVTVLLGTATFVCLGFGLASVIRDADAAQPVTAGVTLPLYFISGVFLPAQLLPHFLLRVAGFLPVRPFELALLAAYNPHSAGAGFAVSASAG